jgi:hypothetical protein
MMVAACAALVGAYSRKRRSRSATNLSNVFVRQARNVSGHRGDAGARLRDLRRVHRVRLIAALIAVLDLARIGRDRGSDVAVMTTEYLTWGVLIRRSVISASVKPFTTSFAAQYAVCGTCGPMPYAKPSRPDTAFLHLRIGCDLGCDDTLAYSVDAVFEAAATRQMRPMVCLAVAFDRLSALGL